MTNDLIRRCYEHISGLNDGFTKKYKIHKLVYFDFFELIELAILHEKRLKGLSREKKNVLINNFNPQWKELFVNGVVINPKNPI